MGLQEVAIRPVVADAGHPMAGAVRARLETAPLPAPPTGTRVSQGLAVGMRPPPGQAGRRPSPMGRPAMAGGDAMRPPALARPAVPVPVAVGLPDAVGHAASGGVSAEVGPNARLASFPGPPFPDGIGRVGADGRRVTETRPMVSLLAAVPGTAVGALVVETPVDDTTQVGLLPRDGPSTAGTPPVRVVLGPAAVTGVAADIAPGLPRPPRHTDGGLAGA